jgi:hypothetical protein
MKKDEEKMDGKNLEKWFIVCVQKSLFCSKKTNMKKMKMKRNLFDSLTAEKAMANKGS